MNQKAIRNIVISWLISLFCLSALIYASDMFNQRDDQYRLLGLKRARDAFEVASAEFERQTALFDKGLISRNELDQAKGRFSEAEVNYHQSLLAVLFEEQFISVQSAIKYHDDDGRRHVSLTLANTSGGSEEFRKLINVEDELFRSLQPDVINNVYVSLMNDENAIVSQPYESKLVNLRYGHPQTVDFALLQDLDAVTVFLIYGNGNQRSMKILLQKDASVNRVAVLSEQFSQEVELGKTAAFDLNLELFSGVNNTFTLEVVNLPREISRYFKSADGQVRLRQIKFTESSRSKKAILEIILPDRSTGEVLMDKSIPFYVLVLPNDKLKEFGGLQDHIWTGAELEKIDVGYARLELIPRGKGELVVRSPQLYHSLLPDESAEMTIELYNEGSRRIDQVEIKVDLPLNWSYEIDPAKIESLDVNEETKVKFRFTPPPDISVGKYEVRIQTSGLSNGQPVNGPDKTATIEIRAETSVVGTVIIVFFILAIVGGVVIFGIRLSRK